MDESWKMRMGMPELPRRRSTEGPSIRSFSKGAGALNYPDDFSDVFGGPPRSVISRQLSGELGHKQFDIFYEEVFRPPEFFSSSKNAGRSLPVFRIPSGGEGFYNDIFGSDHERRSRDRSRQNSQNSKGKSKSNSSSVLSSEEASPFRHVIGDDVVLSSFAAKLRPINIPTKWNSSKMKQEEHQKKQGMPFFSFNPSTSMDNQYVDNEVKETFRSSYSGFPRRPVSSPETISLEPNSYRSMKISGDDLEPNSPSSAISSMCKPDIQINVLAEEDDEVMSSYVIEIGSDNREGINEAVALDEVIAWAKEKFNSQTSETDLSTRQNDSEQFVETEGVSCEISGEQLGVHDTTQSAEVEERIKSAEEEKAEAEKDMEMEDIDEDIMLWSSGKEINIRLLLSTLHHILWPGSGWHVTPLVSLMEGTQVKKAYQKARLCLHPDKLQQRGATNMQKYVAEKAFTILQEAWTAFISEDAFF